MSGFNAGAKVKSAHNPEFYGEGYVVSRSPMGDHRDVLWLGVPGDPESIARQVVTVHIGNLIEMEG